MGDVGEDPRERRGKQTQRTVDAELDELRVDVGWARDAEIAMLELGRVHALVERLVLEDAEVLHAVPLRPRLGVLSKRVRW